MAKKGKPMPAAERAKRSAAMKAYHRDPANRKRIAEARKKTAETQRRMYEDPRERQRMSEVMRRYFAENPDARKKRSEAQTQRFRREVSEQNGDGPTVRRCSRCREVKPLAAFSVHKRKGVSGVVSVRPMSWCKPCNATAAKERRERKIAEGIDVWAQERANYAKRMRDPKNREAARRYAREWANEKRREEGRPARNGWHKYHKRSYIFLPTEPIARFLEERLRKEGSGEIAALTGLHERRLYAIRKRETPQVRLETVDALLTGLNCPEEMHRLYPDASVGYHYLNPDGTPVLNGLQAQENHAGVTQEDPRTRKPRRSGASSP